MCWVSKCCLHFHCRYVVALDTNRVTEQNQTLFKWFLSEKKPIFSPTLPSGPCPPTNVEVSLQCNGNMGIVRWTAARNAEMYIATAMGNDGHSHTCTSNGTSCNFKDLHCEENYTITVVIVERGCQSEPSTPVTLRSGKEIVHIMTSCFQIISHFVLFWDNILFNLEVNKS